MNTLPDFKLLTHSQKDELIMLLWEQNQLLRQQNETLQTRVTELEAKVKKLEDSQNKNSGNSSKPPSSDGFKKPAPKSRRGKSKKKPGGQKGHKGSTLQRVAEPDKVVVLPVTQCSHCDSQRLTKGKLKSSRQVYDIPPLTLEVTEYQVEEKQCLCCGELTRADFPEFATQPVQYGPEIRSIMVYLHQYQLLPYERLAECFKDLFNQTLSQGTLFNTSQTAYYELAQSDEAIKQAVVQSNVVHADETSLRYNKSIFWLHVASNARYTHYNIHAKRGKEGILSGGVLPNFKGTLVHDYFKAYYHFGHEHGLCNAHILRELTFLQEHDNCKWAKSMEFFLLNLKRKVEEHYAGTGMALDEMTQEKQRRRFMNIVYRGRQECPKRKPPEGIRKRMEQSKAWCLLERLRFRNKDVLRFMYNPEVPFDNNQAERDIRMTKVKQKISGCYRSVRGMEMFCRIRSYISTLRKNKLSVIEGLRNIFYFRSKLDYLAF